jgi:hypothetical protein
MSKDAPAPHCSTVDQAGVGACGEANEKGDQPSVGLDGDSISALISFFKRLDEWDREVNLQ